MMKCRPSYWSPRKEFSSEKRLPHCEKVILLPSDPFFSNDLTGIAKILGVIVAPITGFLGWLVVKVVRGPNQAADAQLQTAINTLKDEVTVDVDGLGQRLNEVQQACTRNATSTDELRLQVQGHTFEIGGLRESMGEIRKSVDALEQLTISSKTEIIDAFQKRTSEQVAAVHDLAIAVTRVETRLEERSNTKGER